MEEFSQASGVSRPTVSRYFSDPESVRPATRERIERALKTLRYSPNLFASNFNRKSPKTFAVVAPSLTDPFYANLVEQIEQRALREGYWTIVLTSHGEAEMEVRAIRLLMSLRLAGAAAAPLGMASDVALFKELRETTPLVLLDSRIDVDAPFVGGDNAQSVALMVDYLRRTGEAPCWFDMPPVNHNASERRAAYIAAMQRLGAEPMVIPAPSRSWAFEAEGCEQAERYFAQGAPRRTILCATDRGAFGVLAAANRRGLRVGAGGDLRVAGHDDHPLSRFACPSLTTVAQDSGAMADLAVNLLVARDGAAATKSCLLQARLVMRDSA
ncbi:MAG: LacI family DNA-binding transcriptional regulator [Pseudomonadota bacterium]|nr:LacI family DNA-binding transcriptional regulator [Pseudomonadota bacterium]